MFIMALKVRFTVAIVLFIYRFVYIRFFHILVVFLYLMLVPLVKTDFFCSDRTNKMILYYTYVPGRVPPPACPSSIRLH